jgi:hypothetical protein
MALLILIDSMLELTSNERIEYNTYVLAQGTFLVFVSYYEFFIHVKSGQDMINWQVKQNNVVSEGNYLPESCLITDSCIVS